MLYYLLSQRRWRCYNSIWDPPENDAQNFIMVTVKLNAYTSVPSVGQEVTVMGWGDTDISKDFDPDTTYDMFFPDVLMNADVSVISNDECDVSRAYISESYLTYTGSITDSMICTRTSRKGDCKGNSGCPFVIRGNDGNIQAGVVPTQTSSQAGRAHKTRQDLRAATARRTGKRWQKVMYVHQPASCLFAGVP